MINDNENKEMFEENDREIEKKYELVKKEWEIKRQKFDQFKRMKDNYCDFDYFCDNADF
jgi:hypothetical protein